MQSETRSSILMGRLRDDQHLWMSDREEIAHHIAAQDAEIARLRAIVSRVQSAAKTIMIGEADELRRLREQHREWHLAIKSLDSEREANAILTAENEALRFNPETGHD